MGRFWFSWLTFLWSIKPNYSETLLTSSSAPLTDTDMIISAHDNILSFHRELSSFVQNAQSCCCWAQWSSPGSRLWPLSLSLSGLSLYHARVSRGSGGSPRESRARDRLSPRAPDRDWAEPVLARCTALGWLGRPPAQPAAVDFYLS